MPLGLREGRARVREQDLIILRDRANLEQGLHAAAHDLAITVRDLESSYEQYLAFRETRAAADRNLIVQIERVPRSARSIYLNVLQALNDWGNVDHVRGPGADRLQHPAGDAGAADRDDPGDARPGVHRGALPGRRPALSAEHDPGLPARPEADRASRRSYPNSGEPGENAFDLTKPDIRPAKMKDLEPGRRQKG